MNEFLSFLEKKEGQRILDIGTGNGRFILELKKSIASFSEIIGVDTNDKSIEQARKTFQDDQRVQFEVMPFENLNFEDNYFDLVTMSNVLHHMPHADLVLQEVKRVLKDNGKLFIIELYQDNQTETQQAHVLQHHFRAKIDMALGTYHGFTFKRSEIIKLLEQNNLHIENTLDFNDKTRMKSSIKTDFDSVTDGVKKYISLADTLPLSGKYKEEGEQLLKQIHSIGFEMPTQLITIAKFK